MLLNRRVLLMLCLACQMSPFMAVIVLDEHVNDVKSDMEDLHENNYKHPKVLSRKRRYLEFPEGSSFQLVYDLLVGIVDYTNYIAVSMTLALAFELPSEAPSELLEDVEDSLRDGTFGINRNDTVKHIEYVDKNKITTHQAKPFNNVYYINSKSSPLFTTPMHPQHYGFSQKDDLFQHQYSGRRRNDPYYYSKKSNPFEKFSQNFQKLRYSPSTPNYPWWNLPNRIKNTSEKRLTAAKVNIQSHFRNLQNIRETTRSQQARHQIFPIFGKRKAHSDYHGIHKRYRRNGINTEYPHKLDRIHIRYQRSTRHKLYDLIENYLERKKNLNGHSCVLRTLCETGKKSQENQPGSFIGELMRAIFTLPEPLDEDVEKRQIGYKAQRYDSVHTMEADCSVHYQQCEHSLWSSHFVA